jgi:hypothetical protein
MNWLLPGVPVVAALVILARARGKSADVLDKFAAWARMNAWVAVVLAIAGSLVASLKTFGAIGGSSSDPTQAVVMLATQPSDILSAVGFSTVAVLVLPVPVGVALRLSTRRP